MFEEFAHQFAAAATALMNGAKLSGYTSNGLKKLDFVVNGKSFTALEQNADKVSVPGKLAREGRWIVQIKDNDSMALIGNIDVAEKRFNVYGTSAPAPIDIGEIEKAVGEVGTIQIVAASNANSAKTASMTRNTVESVPKMPSQLATYEIDRLLKAS